LWIAEDGPLFDAAIVDFPDPSTFSVGKLYTRLFYARLRKRLQPTAKIGIQCTSPLVAPRSFWCIVGTLEAAGFTVQPYRASVPTFGVWGYVLASPSPFNREIAVPQQVVTQLRFLNASTISAMFDLPTDLYRVPSAVNRLNDQVLVRLYDQEWSRWN
jgi:spermidine synthase